MMSDCKPSGMLPPKPTVQMHAVTSKAHGTGTHHFRFSTSQKHYYTS